MPFTPFHLGPALLLGLVFFGYVDLSTFLIANIIVDIEPFLDLTLNLRYPVHGFLHSFMGGTLMGFLLVIIMKKIAGLCTPVLAFFKLEQKESLGNILLASFSGIYIHILLDSPLYSEMRPFYPLDINPFRTWNALTSFEVYASCTMPFIGAIVVYTIKLIHQKKKQ